MTALIVVLPFNCCCGDFSAPSSSFLSCGNMSVLTYRPHGQVLVVANPANTNALILKEFAPSIPEKNITCLTRLDHNRALGQIAERLEVPVSSVKNVIIWGNHSSSQYPDVNHAVVEGPDGEKSVRSTVSDDAWYVL
jgi:malate dehydrogenase